MPFGNARQMGFNNSDEIVAHLVIITGSGGGLFIYSPSEAFGNLVASAAAAAGTDQFGNTYRRGISVGPNTGPQAVLDFIDNVLGVLAGVFAMPSNDAAESEIAELATRISGAGTTRTILTVLAGAKTTVRADNVDFRLGSSSVDGTTVDAIGRLVYNDPVHGANTHLSYDVAGILAKGVWLAVHPGTGTSSSPAIAEGWQTPSLGTGFASAGTPNAVVSYQLEGINGLRVRLRGQVNLTANQLANATIFTLPSGYVPAWNHSYPANNNLSGYSATTTAIRVEGTAGASPGAVMIGVAGTTGNFISLDGITVDLD